MKKFGIFLKTCVQAVLDHVTLSGLVKISAAMEIVFREGFHEKGKICLCLSGTAVWSFYIGENEKKITSVIFSELLKWDIIEPVSINKLKHNRETAFLCMDFHAWVGPTVCVLLMPVGIQTLPRLRGAGGPVKSIILLLLCNKWPSVPNAAVVVRGECDMQILWINKRNFNQCVSSTTPSYVHIWKVLLTILIFCSCCWLFIYITSWTLCLFHKQRSSTIQKGKFS